MRKNDNNVLPMYEQMVDDQFREVAKLCMQMGIQDEVMAIFATWENISAEEKLAQLDEELQASGIAYAVENISAKFREWGHESPRRIRNHHAALLGIAVFLHTASRTVGIPVRGLVALGEFLSSRFECTVDYREQNDG